MNHPTSTRLRAELPQVGQQRLPLEPLRHVWFAHGRNGILPSNLELAAFLDVHPRQVHRWAREGLTEHYADRIACRLGVHPSWIWPDWWDNRERFWITGRGMVGLSVFTVAEADVTR